MNPEIEKHLDTLADWCCESMKGHQTQISGHCRSVLKSLLMSGYARQSGRRLQAEVEKRARAKCAEPAMHRGGELSGLTGQLQEVFNELAKWESDQPKTGSPPKSANYSSVHDT